MAADRVDAKTAKRLAPYRAGYTPQQRRDIEQRLVAGELLGVSATDALELGIDIGLLDCAISVGFPGTVASLRQQWGRAGRRGHGLALLVASEDALDQYFMREPETLLGRRVEAAILDHANPRVLDGHVAAAAFEAPIDDADRATLGDEALERAPHVPELQQTPRGWVWAGKDYPAGRTQLRSATADSFTVIDASTGSVLGIVERERAYSTVHEGAVYLHMGEQWLVRELDHAARHAVVEPFSGDWYTQAKKETSTDIEESLRVERRLGLTLTFGRVAVTEQVVAYQRKSIRDQATLDTVQLDLPATTFDTEAVWYVPTAGQLEGLEQMPTLLSSLHAAEHSMIALLPLWAMCDGLHLRRASGRRRHRGARLRPVRRLGRRHRAHARGLPLRARLSLLRAKSEMREPERVARQGRRSTTLEQDVEITLARSSFLRHRPPKEESQCSTCS